MVGIVLLDSLEVVQNCLAIVGQFHLRAEVQVDVEIIAQRAVPIHAEVPFMVDVSHCRAGPARMLAAPNVQYRMAEIALSKAEFHRMHARRAR